MAAADELGLTPTAISHQIRLLETVIGEALFRRRPRPLTLTLVGAALFPVVKSSFDALAEAFGVFRDNVVAPRLRLPATADSIKRTSGLFSAQKSASASSLSKIGTSSHLAIARIYIERVGHSGLIFARHWDRF